MQAMQSNKPNKWGERNSKTNETIISHRLRNQFKRVGVCTNLCRVSSAGHVLGPDGLFDAVHLLLVPLAVSCCVLFGLLQCRLQSLHTFSCRTQTLLQLGQLTAQICVITHELDTDSGYCWNYYTNLITIPLNAYEIKFNMYQKVMQKKPDKQKNLRFCVPACGL